MLMRTRKVSVTDDGGETGTLARPFRLDMPPPRPLPSLGKKAGVQLHPVAPRTPVTRASSRLQLFQAKKRSKLDHSHDFDRKAVVTPEKELEDYFPRDAAGSSLSTHEYGGFEDEGNGICGVVVGGNVGIGTERRASDKRGSTTLIVADDSKRMTKELAALKSIQGRIDHVMHAFDESMSKASGDAGGFDSSGDVVAPPLTWKVGEILMATHESLTMASGFNERLFTKDMDEVKVLMSRDSQSVVDDWATENTPAMRKITKLFHETVGLLQEMKSTDLHGGGHHHHHHHGSNLLLASSPSASMMAPLTSVASSVTPIVRQMSTTGPMDDATKVVLRLQNEKSILMGQLTETSNMYTAIAEIVKDREREVKRLHTLLTVRTDEVAKLKQDIFVKHNEDAKKEEGEKTVALWKEKYMGLYAIHQVVDKREREASKRGTDLSAQLKDMTAREGHAQTQLKETMSMLTACQEENKDQADKLMRLEGLQSHGVNHQYEFEIKELKAKLKELKDHADETQKVHKKALERQRTELKKHFDGMLKVGGHGFTESHLLLTGNDTLFRRSSVSAPTTAAPDLPVEVDDDDEEDANDEGEDGPTISDDDDDETGDEMVEDAMATNNGSHRGSVLTRSRRASVQEQQIHHQISGMITKAFVDGSMGQSLAAVVPPTDMVSLPQLSNSRRRSIMIQVKGMPVQVDVLVGSRDDSNMQLSRSIASERRRRTSMKGSISSHDLTREAQMSSSFDGSDAAAAFDATMEAIDGHGNDADDADEENPELTMDDRLFQLKLKFETEKAVLKRKYIDSMLQFRQQIIEQYDKKATEMTKKHRSDVLRITHVAESKYGKLLDEKETLLKEARRTIKSLYKTLGARPTPSSFAATGDPVDETPPETATVQRILRSTYSLVAAKRMSTRLKSRRQSEIAALVSELQQLGDPRRSSQPPTPVDPRPLSPGSSIGLADDENDDDGGVTSTRHSPVALAVTPSPRLTTPEPLPEDMESHAMALLPATMLSPTTSVDISLAGPQPPPPELRVFEPRSLAPRPTIAPDNEQTTASTIARPSMRHHATQVGEDDWADRSTTTSELEPPHKTFSKFVLEGSGLKQPSSPPKKGQSLYELAHPEAAASHGGGGATSCTRPPVLLTEPMLLVPRLLLGHHAVARNAMYTPPSVDKVPTRHAVHQLLENYANTLTTLRENINWNKWSCVLKCLGLKRMEDVLRVEMDTSSTVDHALVRLRRRFVTKRAAFSMAHAQLQHQQKETWSHCMDALVHYNTMGGGASSSPNQQGTATAGAGALDIRGTSLELDSPATTSTPHSPHAFSPRHSVTAPATTMTTMTTMISSPADLLDRCRSPLRALTMTSARAPNDVSKRALALASLLPTDISMLSMEERHRYLLELHAYLQSPILSAQPVPPPSRASKLPVESQTTIKGIPAQSPFMRRKALESLQRSMLHTRQHYAESSDSSHYAVDQSGRSKLGQHRPPTF
ncbi:Aste57867_12754 [Aphanomyces stellatus]|uniref:Aste57867_12754 protein n=1 Tax=Aphanomyces stellatus TaxID=120398 RepID=A0A485KXT1_9STRA|nr:hypothetical protein As57867_012706 [Aphanomyces stellatus]VFT89603.1 Aste57867_12754 [Aphanomyces stellatus]